MIKLVTCDRYQVIKRIPDDEDPVEACATAMEERGDGFAVIAFDRDGRMLSDSVELTEHAGDGPPYDAATATGMYDYY
jgi:hypothetical protein